MGTQPRRPNLFRPLYIALLLYLIAGGLEAGLIFARSSEIISVDLAATGKKVVILFSTLSTVILLRWIIVDTPFNFLRKYTVAPLLKSILSLLIYFVAAMTLLNKIFGINIKPLLTTSAVLTGVLALSLQETLKNLFTGLWINTERVVAKGDWIKIADKEGQVLDVTWRTTRLLTRTNNCIYLPNRMLAEGVLENCSHPTPLHVVEVMVAAGYHDPPNKVKEILLDMAKETTSVLKKPEPEVLIAEFGDYSINYRLRTWIDVSHSFFPNVRNELYGKIWYGFKRNNIELPFPVRTIHHREEEKAPSGEMILASLKDIDFLRPLSDEELKRVASSSRIDIFGKCETIVRQGEAGDTCYFIQSGSVDVMLADSTGRENYITTLRKGEFFGEMSLLAGEPRTATVVAREDCKCIVVSSQAFHTIFTDNPDLAESLSELLVRRSGELEEIRNRAVSEMEKAEAETAARHKIRNKIRKFFKMS